MSRRRPSPSAGGSGRFTLLLSTQQPNPAVQQTAGSIAVFSIHPNSAGDERFGRCCAGSFGGRGLWVAKAKQPSYPFVPRSNGQLIPGQFFSFPLSNGRYACGRVLGTPWGSPHGKRTIFLVGLMDWTGDRPATADDLAGRAVLAQGLAHVVILQDYGATIDGHRPLEADGIVPDLAEERVYGRDVLRILAHKYLAAAPPAAVRLDREDQ